MVKKDVLDFLKDILIGTISGLELKKKALDLYNIIIADDSQDPEAGSLANNQTENFDARDYDYRG
jgi:hypothetical protein